MKKRHLSTVASIGIGLGLGVLTQNMVMAQAENEEGPAVLPEFETIDTNEDGMIGTTEAEMLAKTLKEQHDVEFEFETVDENDNGTINSQEYMAYDEMLEERLREA